MIKWNWLTIEYNLWRLATVLLIAGVVGSYLYGYQKGQDSVYGAYLATRGTCLGGEIELRAMEDEKVIRAYCIQRPAIPQVIPVP